MSQNPLAEARQSTERSHPRLANAHTSRIESIGVRLPEQRLATKDLMQRCRRAARVDLETLTGIRSRRVCREGEDSLSLAIDAAWDCLSRSRHRAADLDVLISCSITKYVDGLSYRFEPAMSLSIKEALGASQCLNFDVTNACAGMLTGVSILDAMIRAGSIRCGMVVSGEYISSIADNATRSVRTIASRQLASLTVGDSGAAVIVDRSDDPEQGIRACEITSIPEHSELCIGKPFRSGPGAVMHTRAKKLHQEAIGHALPVIRRALDRSGWPIEEIDFVIPHQTSVRAIRAGTKRFTADLGGFARHDMVNNLEEYGNTASTTHFIALDRYLKEGRLRSSDRVMLLGFASGIVIGALAFTVGEIGASHAHAH
jgi:3-oxoacyl-[acyl-carrier-protein] synthase-3